MPRRPKTPCRYPGCNQLCDGRYCDVHTKLTNQSYEKFERGYKTGDRYGKNWQVIRDRYIAQHPICEDCLEFGISPPRRAEEVHHIRPLSRGGTHAPENLRALCKPCHSRHTAAEGDRWKRRERVVYSYPGRGTDQGRGR